MDNQFSQEKLDRFVRFNLDDIVLFQKMSGKKSSFDETTLNPSLSHLDYPTIVFKYSILDRIIVLFISAMILLVSVVLYLQGIGIQALIIGFAIAFILNISFWFRADKKILELTENGVTYKSEKYKWSEIEKTMIWSKAIFSGKRSHRDYTHYLVLALKNGEILTFEINDLYLQGEKGTEISRFILKEYQLISHFVEYFKGKAGK